MPLTHLATAFAIAHPGVTSAIIGPRTMAHLDDLLAGAGTTLSDDVLDRIDAIVAPGTDVGTLDTAYVPPAVDPAAPACAAARHPSARPRRTRPRGTRPGRGLGGALSISAPR